MGMLTLALVKGYTDSQRLAYEEVNKTTYLETADRVFTKGTVVITADNLLADIEALRTIGHKSKVYFDGVWHEGETHKYVDADGNVPGAYVIIGNSERFAGRGDTGEPFAILVYLASTRILIAYLDERGVDGATSTHAVGIFDIEETIHPIDPKYLPGVCLPVVELSTVATAEGAMLTAEESAMMDEMAERGMPFVLKCACDDMRMSGIATAIAPPDGAVISFTAYASDAMIMLMKEVSWMVMTGAF